MKSSSSISSVAPKDKLGKPEATKTKIDREMNKKLHKILNLLINDPESSEFRKPVYYKALGLEDYKKIIKKPMDLNTVRRNLTKNIYENLEEILDDIQLIWNNCKLYNEQGSWIYLTAVKLETSFHGLCLDYFPSTPLPSNKIPDKALLLLQHSEKTKQKQPLSKDQMIEENNKNSSSAIQTGLNQQGTISPSQNASILAENMPSKNNIAGSAYSQIPFRFSSKGIIRRNNQMDFQHVPFLKFANDKQKFDQLISVTKNVSKLQSIHQLQILDIIQEFQPQIVTQVNYFPQLLQRHAFTWNQDDNDKKGVDFHLVSEFTFDLLQNFITLVKNQQISELMDEETDQDSSEEPLQTISF